MASLFSTIQSRVEKAGFLPRTKESKDWFYRKIRTLSNISPSKILTDTALATRPRPLIGRMFMFLYDPKHKETLPYYDRFPLILMVGPAKKGFYGLNLHYLPPRQRAVFFDRLTEYTNNNKLDETTRFRLSYDLLNSTRRLRAFAPCFKHYLFDHVSSKTVEILPKEWEIALFLPTESFIGKAKNSIWNSTRGLV